MDHVYSLQYDNVNIVNMDVNLFDQLQILTYFLSRCFEVIAQV